MRQTAAMENLFASCKLSQNKSTAQNKNQKDVVDHQINLCHTGIVLQAFCNRTNTSISELVAPLHHKSLHTPPALVSLGTLNHNHALFTGSCRISPTSHTPSVFQGMPLLTILISFRRLNRPRFAPRGWISSSLSCCVECSVRLTKGRGRGVEE